MVELKESPNGRMGAMCRIGAIQKLVLHDIMEDDRSKSNMKQYAGKCHKD